MFLEEIRYQEENYIVIDFYYGKMVYQTSEEELTYEFFNMIGRFCSSKVRCFRHK